MKYIEDLKRQYISGLLSHFYERAEIKPGQQIIGIKALLSLTQKNRIDSAIPRKEIREEGEFSPGYSGVGMWGWLEAGVVEKLNEPAKRRIRPEFYEVLLQLCNKY